MHKFLFFILFLAVLTPCAQAKNDGAEELPASYNKLYHDMNLEGIVSFSAFEMAMDGYHKLEAKNKDTVTLIDFSKPSTDKRFHVLDIKNRKLLLSSVVSHGINSGEKYATSFSNTNGSHKSSLGFFLTGHTYQGKNGYSLILNGLEQNINDRAKERAIVIHGADYANPSVIATAGRLGRSYGCPALPHSVAAKAIDLIKNGSLIFIYAAEYSRLKGSKRQGKKAELLAPSL